jgi:hypothetical protein
MKPLSPVDAISPSFSRMRTLLLPPGFAPGVNAPFRFWFFVKITIVGAFTSTSMYSTSVIFLTEAIFIALAFAGMGSAFRHAPFDAPHNLTTVLLLVVILAGAIALAVWIILGWLWCRLRFTLFDLALFRHGRVGLAWSRYGAPAWRYLGLTILATFVFVLVLALTAGPFVLHFFLTFSRLSPQQINADPGFLISHILPLYGFFFLAVCVVAIVDAVMQDFLLPPMAIENAPVEDSIRRFLHLLRNRPGSLALYLLLRFVLQIAFAMAVGMACMFVLVIFGLVGFGLGFAIYHGTAHSGAAGYAIFIAYCVVAGGIFVALYLFVNLCLNGAIAIFRECYTLYFYGSYYPQLGDYIELHAPALQPNSAPPLEPSPGSSPAV